MAGRTLGNPPLIEAIFEIGWQVKQTEPEGSYDPDFPLLIGRLSERLEGIYPYHESLPAASLPGGMAVGIVQHRFRTGKDQWPLVQLGPGIFTVNAVKGYTWDDFERRICDGVSALCIAYPKTQNLNIDRLQLRYINGIEFDFGITDIFQFLRDQMRIQLALSAPLFQDTGVGTQPLGLDLRFAFGCTRPKATVHFRLARGRKDAADALIWETIVRTDSGDVPSIPDGLDGWLDDAHRVAEHWFLELVKGDLLRSFE